MTDARPSLDVLFQHFGVPATVALPTFAEFAQGPESAAITVVMQPPPPMPVPEQLDPSIFRRWDKLICFKRADAPQLRKGAGVRAPEVAGGPIDRWVVDVVTEVDGDEVRAMVYKEPV
jgi:hypothetical protein